MVTAFAMPAEDDGGGGDLAQDLVAQVTVRNGCEAIVYWHLSSEQASEFESRSKTIVI
jgi:hypothetical protein